MCRFCIYLGDEIEIADITTRHEDSIINQSFDAKHGRSLNGDGFGIGWYGKKKNPGQFRSISPAWNNPNLRNLSEHIRSGCILVHVRAATPGLPVIFVNNHPFMMNNVMMVHNGSLGGFLRYKQDFIALLDKPFYQKVEGSTDSEHLFALIMTYFKNGGDDNSSSWCERMEKAIKMAFLDVKRLTNQDEACELNIAISNGEHAVATRFTINTDRELSLYYRQSNGIELADKKLIFKNQGSRKSLFISSEPLDKDENLWTEVEDNSILLNDKTKDLIVHSLNI